MLTDVGRPEIVRALFVNCVNFAKPPSEISGRQSVVELSHINTHNTYYTKEMEDKNPPKKKVKT